MYPLAKKEQSNSSAVVLNMKNSDWNAEDGNGFSIYSRYQAGNMSYRLRFYGNSAVIEKVALSNVVSALATSAKMNISSKNYYEVAFETINDEKGEVTLNAYFDGKLIVSVKDADKPYLRGDYAVECTGEVRPYIDEINCISITEPMYKLNAEGEKPTVTVKLNGKLKEIHQKDIKKEENLILKKAIAIFTLHSNKD